MDFKSTTIAPAGRNKYGNYLSSGNVTRSVITTTYAGNGTTTSIAEGDQSSDNPLNSFYCILSKANATYNAVDLVQGINDSTTIIAYRGNDKGYTYICDFDNVTAETDTDNILVNVEAPENMGIIGLECGITATILHNGTTGTTVMFHVDSMLTGNTGTIKIPVNIYMRKDATPEPDNLLDWYDSAGDCETVWLEFVWNINRNASSNYLLDLSNQSAGVNCDADGNLYINSIATLQCTATTYYNGEVATGITYSASSQPAYAAIGYSIDANTGVLTFNTAGTIFYWTTLYPSLPIDIVAYKDGAPIGTKTMTISRNYPGADGTPAHTRYIVTDTDVVSYNPNTNIITPASVVGRVMLQVGDELPVYDSSTTIYQWYDDIETGKSSAAGSITANTYVGLSKITFALKNDDDEYFEVEEVPVISSGVNGEIGESAWYLTLSNDNASINCDADGNILPGAVRPTCQAKLYYGQTLQTGATFDVSTGGATGVTYYNRQGVLVFRFLDTFNFTGTTLSITISGKVDGVVRDTKIMTITKSIAGENGEDAVSYWLEPSFGEILYDPNHRSVTPNSITCTAYKQVGQEEVEEATDVTIKYQWQKRSDSTWTSETPYSSSIPVTSGNCVSYYRLRLNGYVGSTLVDQEDIDIISDGTNGADGEPGESAWYLTLSNDNASINCDAGGNILPGAVRPTCQAKLYYGQTRMQSVQYDVDYGNATGVTTSVTDGILTLNFGSDFKFNTSVLPITVSASTESELRDVKIMTVTKSYAGENGEDAITYWLEPSFTEVIYNPNNLTVDPSLITCSAYKQIGQQAVIPAYDVTITYRMYSRLNHSFSVEQPFPSTGLTIASRDCQSFSRIRLIGKISNSQVDQEDVDIVMNGTNGTDGTDGVDGRTGPSIRGPYDYATHFNDTRCWCSGQNNGTCDDCQNWIDVIVKDGVYYYCSTTYYGSLVPWNEYKNNWTSGTSFDFVATNLLLANNASINFLTGNELYLRDSNGNITAGAKGGDSVNFWAGGDTPGTAPYQVLNDGTIIATKGSFGNFTIGKNERNDGALISTATTNSGTYKYDDNIIMSTEYMKFQGSQSNTYSPYDSYSNTVYIMPTMRDNYGDLANGVMSVDMQRAGNDKAHVDSTAFWTNGNIQCGRLQTKKGNAVSTKPFDVEIIYTTTSADLFQKSGYWHIDGQNTGIPYVQPIARFLQLGNRWYYGNENLGITTTSSSPVFTSGDTSSIVNWTFNGNDLGINAGIYTSVYYNSAYNAWVATSYSSVLNTGIEHTTDSYGNPAAIYYDIPATYPINISSNSLFGSPVTTNRGNYREVYCTPNSSSQNGTLTLALSSEGTMSDVHWYTSDSWITVSRTSGVSQIVRVSITQNTGARRYGYVELFVKNKFGVRIVIEQA